MKNETACSLVQDLLPSYIDRLTSERSNQFIQQHVRQCEACRQVYDAMSTQSPPMALHAEDIVRKMLRLRKRRRRRNIILLLSVVLATAICLLPLPRSIHMTYDAVQWRCGENDDSHESSVVIDGVYFDFLFKDDIFDGSVTVSDLPETQRELKRVTFYDGLGTLFYITEDGVLDEFGWIVLHPAGHAFTVGIYGDNGWSGSGGLMLTGPAATREEAVKLTNALCSKYSPDFTGGWSFE